MWSVELSEDALRDLSNLDNKTVKRIVKKLEQSAQNPVHYFTRLVGHDEYRLRVGDYRILVLLLHQKKTIYVEKIGHRKNVYK